MNKYKLSNLLPLLLAASAVGAVFYATNADATKPLPPKPPEQRQIQDQHQGQEQGQDQSQSSESYSDSVATSEAASEANNEGNSLSVESSYESGPADIVLVPQGHTSNCMRTYGVSFGNREGGGGIGWPYRDRSCDFEANANAADLQGNYQLGWFWRCQKKNSYRVFKVKGGTNESAIEACVARNSGENFMTKLIEQQKEEIRIITLQKEQWYEDLQQQKELCKTSNERVHEKCQSK